MKPIKRILRPTDNTLKYFGHNHLIDPRYCAEKFQLIHAFHILQKDFKNLFDYIELHDINKPTFSHRIYELILRACTEFEANCKGILLDNGYSKSGNFNITDYFKINGASKLNQYEVRINVWTPNALNIIPFFEWNSTSFTPLNWYQTYNQVKHDRNSNFHLASLENLINCMAGLFVILASQFAHQIFSPYQITDSHSIDDDGYISVDSSVFSIKFPTNWTAEEIKSFNWEEIKNEAIPFDQFLFI